MTSISKNLRNGALTMTGWGILTALALLAPGTAAPSSTSQDDGQPRDMATAPPPYSPSLRMAEPTSLFWGDLHLHTSLSTDAFVKGSRLLRPDDAFRFAKGETVIADNGEPARLRRPLDFLAVTDHAENLGLFTELAAGNPAIASGPIATRWNAALELTARLGLRDGFRTALESGPLPDLPADVLQNVWQRSARTADRHNSPGQFTALIGYEWTSMITGDNLHRVVLFRDGADRAGQSMPVNAQVNPDPEFLWDQLQAYEDTGGQVLAIPHNGNLSNGRMFSPLRVNEEPFDRNYAEKRTRWEPVYEVTQVKGDGEAHPQLSPDDEFADFETWDMFNVAFVTPKEGWMLQYEYARSALREGLRHEGETGINPFQFGMVGGTDSHTGLSTWEEDNFFGKFEDSNPSPARTSSPGAHDLFGNWNLGASGATGVWAAENTREAIFDALRRREVYATTGTRIALRMFAGWSFEEGDIDRPNFASLAYRTGVPMGGTLAPSANGGAPTFLLQAARDPLGANLDRMQVVKGWIDEAGETHERIYDVALSDPRRRQAGGLVAPVGSSVDVESASYRNSIGTAELASWWQDPDFDPAQSSFYYVRVLEIPTPRWTSYDSAFFETMLRSDVPAQIQERAYSSPVWYRPPGQGSGR